MDIVKIEKLPRSNPFAIAAAIGKLLDEEGYLSVSLVQRKLRMGYTHASRWLDFLVELGELKLNEKTHRYTSLRLTKRAPDAGESGE